MKTSDFDYHLPSELIAQTPIEPRDHSRLMVLNHTDGSLKHRRFDELPTLLRAGDLLVFNDSRVIPARLAAKKESGGRVEVLLLRRLGEGEWEALVKPASRVKPGSRLAITSGDSQESVWVEVREQKPGGLKTLHFSDECSLARLGEMPLPPYIHTTLANPERYQTVYARAEGSAAAPTAGLHFTPELLETLKRRGIDCCFLTLHIGLDTFLPVREADPQRHAIHREYGVLSEEVARRINRAKREGRRVIAVGTTTVRLLEQAAQASPSGELLPFSSWASLFILPGYRFRVADALLTNFHLPRSTLLMLVTAFTGGEVITRAYREAIAQEYRFYSFGDAMLVL